MEIKDLKSRARTKLGTRSKIKNSEKGFAALYAVIVVMAIMAVITLSLIFLIVNQQRILGNSLASYKSFSVAEAGIEDALLRLKKIMNLSNPYNLTLGNGVSNIAISDLVGGTRTITSTGNVNKRIRKVRVVVTSTDVQTSFYYGIQVGDLGLQMDGNAVIHGNVFSNGPVTGASNTKIYGDAISAGPSGRIESIKILSSEGGGSAWATTLEDCKIDGDAHYTNISNCSVGGTHYTPEEGPAPQDMPITQEQIAGWKDDALTGGTISGYFLGGNNKDLLGPVKVEGDMIVDSNAELTITGTIWVTGNLSLNSNVKLQLDSGYGSSSGVIVVDGQISVDSNVVLCGSEGFKVGQAKCNPSIGSYLMLLSTKVTSDPDNPAIYATSNTKTAVLYASDGFIKLSSNAALREATGYGLHMDSNADVTYEIGLADIRFTSGPGGGWKVASWKEIE